MRNGSDEPRYWEIVDETITMMSQYVGKIHLSDKVIVSDPCYTRDVWCMTTLNKVKPGRWTVRASIDTIDSWGKRCYALELTHDDVALSGDPEWEDICKLGVDSGQMSVFDDAYYRRKNGSDEEFEADDAAREAFYGKCCNLSLGDVGIYRIGQKAVGVVCSSGIGDGSYPLYAASKDGEVVAIKIVFI